MAKEAVAGRKEEITFKVGDRVADDVRNVFLSFFLKEYWEFRVGVFYGWILEAVR